MVCKYQPIVLSLASTFIVVIGLFILAVKVCVDDFLLKPVHFLLASLNEYGCVATNLLCPEIQQKYADWRQSKDFDLHLIIGTMQRGPQLPHAQP